MAGTGVSNIVAIRNFFESNGGRKVTMDELKALSTDERSELGLLCAEAMGDFIDLGKAVGKKSAA